MPIPVVIGAIRGLIFGAARDAALDQVAGAVDLNVEITPKDPTAFLREIEVKKQRNMKRALSVTAQTGVNIILQRTAKGYDWKGQSFINYTPSYEQFRVQSGRSTQPNLFFSGNMLGSMTTEVKGNNAYIFFSRKEEAAKASKNNKKRPFMNFNDIERRKLQQTFIGQLYR